jgi:hypothetical protein
LQSFLRGLVSYQQKDHSKSQDLSRDKAPLGTTQTLILRSLKFHLRTSLIILAGEANVYTLGDVGKHRVVTTKLPMTGHTRDALIATGSTTTRLLGTFQVILRKLKDTGCLKIELT